MDPKTILIAGPTGHLGRALVAEGLKRGHSIVALGRRLERLSQFAAQGHLRMVPADVTRPGELRGCCRGVDVVITALGITTQREGPSFRDIDYQANANVLQEALSSGVKKFVYTSGFGIDQALDSPLYRAKKDFELGLQASAIPHLIIRPTGFFSDMMMIFTMAKKGRVYLVGAGSGRLNPIDLPDLAAFYYEHLDDSRTILEVGGPETYSFEAIALLAFAALGKTPRITHLPVPLVRLAGILVRPLSLNTYAEMKAFTRIMLEGAEAPAWGTTSLRDAFKQAAAK
jgi:uncharacterized protein YbjT (DUF2867 family)